MLNNSGNRVCSLETKDGLIPFRIFGEMSCGRQSQSGEIERRRNREYQLVFKFGDYTD